MKINEIPFEPGTKVYEELKVAELHDGTWVNIPMAVMNGKEKGPTLLLTSGMNGNILNGIEAARRIWSGTSPDRLRGRLVVIPIINRPAFMNRQRFNTFENFPGPTQMVGAYPGKPEGMLTERIAYTISQEAILGGIDYYLDIGTGALGGRYASMVLIYPTPKELVERVRSLARAFGATFIVDYSAKKPDEIKGRGPQIGLENGIPSLLSEMGEASNLEEEWVGALEKGVKNFMIYAGMIEGKPDLGPDPVTLHHLKRVNANRGGFLNFKVKLGEKVSKGQLLAEINDVFCHVKERILSPEDGYVFVMTTTLTVSSGDRVLNLGVPK
jgi:predicted deacylase